MKPGVEPTETLIAPTAGWRMLDWREIWAYRDLLRLMVWRDFVARYKQTILGPLWFILQPVLTTLVFAVVFGHMAGISTDGMPPMLFYLSGQLAWNYFAQSLQSTAVTLSGNASLFGKVYFPRLIVPLAAVASNLIAVLIQLGTFLVFFAADKLGAQGARFHLASTAFLLPLVFLQVAVFSLGAGLWLAALTAKFRDFGVLAGFLVQLWMYATPVILPLGAVQGRWRLLFLLNPMTVPVEATRRLLLGRGTVTPGLTALCVGLTLLVAASGVLVFRRAEKTFVDVA
jgi:lipopolysaccharide transport system permease protein